ncbi:hypothetical protein [Mycolicibacterium llatzerense]|uniref:GAP1-N2 domain-containing protein n=1 Tax=Mycolicibacterium llatzerense TaxID=280871 RepID=UPI0008DD64DE|nr:hypothetical protein [Mycolicibacterium llatzerense]
MFDVCVFTDVRADEALDGVAGFNFMAASPGATVADQKFVADRMLHVVKSSWHVDHQDELAHPPSCIYRKFGDRYFLSRGRSTGSTVTAPRPGNQLTQAIVTSAPDDFIPYRPAQLYAARQWNLSRETGGKHISPWPTPLEIDATYEPDELNEDLVVGSPFGTEFLAKFLTMVEQAVAVPAKKLIIVHTDLDVVMRYISLASLFLDADRAFAMSFVAFAQQPLAADADIVGATPDFGETPKANSGSAAYNVVDLLTVEMSPVEVSRSAARQAEWFADDPLDALAAIDVARRWEAALGADLATDAAGIVSFTEGPVAAPHDRAAALRAVHGLVAGGLGDDLDMYSDELLDAIVTSPPAAEADVVLAADAIEACHQSGRDDVGTGILLPTLEVLAARPELIPTWSSAVSRWIAGAGPLQWESADSRAHAMRAQAEIVNRTDPQHLVDVLIAGKIAGLLPDDGVIAPALDRLADHWCQHPELSTKKDDLPYQSHLGPRLTYRIVGALERNDPAVTGGFVAGEWNWLAGHGSPLAPWHAAAAIGTTRLDQRADEIAARGARLPAESWRLVLAGAELPAGAPAVAAWIDSHRDISMDFGAWILKGLKASQSRYEDGHDARRLLSAMLDARVRAADTNLAQLLADVDDLERIGKQAMQAAADDRNPALHDFAERVAPVVALFSPEVGTLLVKSRDQLGIKRLERASGDWAAPCIEGALQATGRRSGDAEAVEWALSLYESGTEAQSGAATEFLLSLMDSRGGRQRLDEARDTIAPSWLPVLDQLVEESRKGRLARNIMRGGKRLFNKEQ